MPKKYIFSYLFILAALFLILSLSRTTSDKAKGRVVSVLAPLWEKFISISAYLHFDSPQYTHETGVPLTAKEEIQRLQLENQLQAKELAYLSQLLDDKQNLKLLLEELATYSLQDLPARQSQYQAYVQRLKKKLTMKTSALPARVIFRSLGTWNSCIWINVGEANNQDGSTKIVAKNSPVLAGNSVIGVIDYVGQNQSRVCLITNPRLTPSVRATRGGEQDAVAMEHVEALLKLLKQKKMLVLMDRESESLVKQLRHLKEKLEPAKKSWYLAKGELRGSARTSSRMEGQLLKGSGFNFDFADEMGEARDLRSGKLIHDPQSAAMPILKLNDVLITTGFDGVFPPGLQVAVIDKIEPLKEGDYFYELEAKPTAGNLDDLSLVFVIPPVSPD